MKPFLKAFLALVGLAIVLGSIAVISVVNRGVSARSEPGAIETFLAGRVRNLAVGRHARALRNPEARTPEIIAAGRAHFADHCASCHANDGSGSTALGRGLYPRPPDLRLAPTQALTDGELFWIIENGIRFTGMPGFGADDQPDHQGSWQLVHFIRHLPEISGPELAEMESLNPAPPDEIRQRLEAEQFLRGGDQQLAAPEAPHQHKGGSE